MRGIAGKTALVTGAAAKGGIGFSCARRLAAEGAKVLLADIDEKALAESTARLRDEGYVVNSVPLNVINEPDWDNAVTRLTADWGRFDVLVNNAGIAVLGNLIDLSLDQFRRQSEINIHGVFLGCRAAMRYMTSHGGGIIINMSSIAAFGSGPGSSAYAASKAAVNMLTKTLALEAASSNVRVNSVHPGLIDTTMISSTVEASPGIVEVIPLRRLGRPDEIAAMVAFLASDDASYCQGGSFIVDGGMSAQ